MKKSKEKKTFKYPGTRVALDGNTAAIMCERESTDAAGAYPITPSTQMGEYWAEEAAKGHLNISDRPLIFIEPEGEHAAAAVTAGLSMTGQRAANFSSGQGIAYMHESLYAAVGKRLTYVLNIGARAMTKSTLNVHAGHDDYHAIDDTGFFQLFAKSAQHVADLNIISHRIAELALTPGAIAQDGFLTTHLIESLNIPERELIKEYLGRPDDIIETPTPAQRIIYGDTRRRIPELWDVDNPVMAGLVQNQDSYMQSVAAQRPFFFDHIKDLTDMAFDEFYELTGRKYERVMTYRCEDAEYLILGQGSVVTSAEAVADYLRETRGIKVGVVDLVMFRPFPNDLIAKILKGKKAVTVLERLDQPLATDSPIVREIRAVISKAIENGRSKSAEFPNMDITPYSQNDIPEIYSGSFGMGSRDLQAEGIIGAVENMIPGGKHKKYFYLSIDFIREKAFTPKQKLYQQSIVDAYPKVKDLAVRGSENPNLMPKGSTTVRFHSIGGWGAITTGKNLAMTLFDLLDYDIKANPKYGSEKKGQPTTYYLAAAPEPIRMNCEFFFVDVVLSPDPNVFKHTNAVAGLKKGGVFIIQSEKDKPEEVWSDIPVHYQRIIVENEIRIFYIDGFKIAREEATDSELQLRMQGIAFQGAFFSVSPLKDNAGLSEEQLLHAIEDQVNKKFGSKGQRVVDDNMRVVKRGFDEVYEITNKVVQTGANKKVENSIPPLPSLLKDKPVSESKLSDIHRFWEQTGNFYIQGMGNDNLTDPFIGLSLMPATSSLFRDMTGIRFEHPEWIPNNCTACGNCYTVCPDTAIPGLVSSLSGVLDTVVKRVKKKYGKVEFLSKEIRKMEGQIREILNDSGKGETVNNLINDVIDKRISSNGQGKDFAKEMEWFRDELGDFQFALTRPYYDLKEKKAPGSGGLFSITVNPNTCKGCMECIEVCDDDALRPIIQTEGTIAKLREGWDFWMDLPNTPEEYNRVDSLEEKIGPLETILLNKEAYLNFASGDGACLGCSEKSVVHLFTATLESLMQPRVEKHLEKIDGLISNLEGRIQERLLSSVKLNDSEYMAKIVADLQGTTDISIDKITTKIAEEQDIEPVDQEWLKHMNRLVSDLKNLRFKYVQGTTGSGRANMGMTNSTGCTSVWGSTYPFNPYPFPWANHLFQDSTSLAMGIFEGHMAKMADGFKAIRRAELELNGEYNPAEHEPIFTYFNWEQFTDEEWLLCPPVVALGGDGAMYDIGFQNLSRMMASGKPIKVIVVDTQVYSNTGGQACTSGFIGQISDMAQYGKVWKGKAEPRKEIGLIAMAHRNTYVMQGTMANTSHMIEGFIDGLMTRRPALFNLYTTCQPEHGVGDDLGAHQAKLAVESRAYPIFKYNPDLGVKPVEAFDIQGNPDMDKLWPTYKLKYTENGREKTMDLPMTFADFAVTEARFRKHFRKAPRDTWNDNMVQLADFLELSEEEREGKFPYIWAVDNKQNLNRVLVAKPIVESCEERRDFWIMIRSIAGLDDEKVSEADIETRVRKEVVGKIATGLMNMVGGNGEAITDLIADEPTPTNGEAVALGSNGEYVAPWIETEECTSCDECTKINNKIFVYNDDKKAYINDPSAGSFSDIVKAAEKCSAQVIHPGLPKDRSDKDIEKWIQRAEKFN